jgi:hypothetical protein
MATPQPDTATPTGANHHPLWTSVYLPTAYKIKPPRTGPHQSAINRAGGLRLSGVDAAEAQDDPSER